MTEAVSGWRESERGRKGPARPKRRHDGDRFMIKVREMKIYGCFREGLLSFLLGLLILEARFGAASCRYGSGRGPR